MFLLDHILVALLIIGLPVWDYFLGNDKMRRDMKRDEPGCRLRFYWKTIGFQWMLTALVLAIWLFTKRSVDELGFTASTGLGFWIGLVLTIIAIASIVLVQRSQMNTKERRREAYKHLKEAAPFLPRNRAEMSHFSALAVTAGICEEIVYRGYLIWYALLFTGDGGLGTTLAIVLPALFFALAHSYQGPSGVMQVFFIGLVFGVLYILTGSLWIPMIAHAIVDIIGGRAALYLARMDDIDNASSPSDPLSPDEDLESSSPGAIPQNANLENG